MWCDLSAPVTDGDGCTHANLDRAVLVDGTAAWTREGSNAWCAVVLPAVATSSRRRLEPQSLCKDPDAEMSHLLEPGTELGMMKEKLGRFPGLAHKRFRMAWLGLPGWSEARQTWLGRCPSPLRPIAPVTREINSAGTLVQPKAPCSRARATRAGCREPA
jgi:hypothetical protein